MMDDLISRQFAIKELESGKDKKAKGEIGGFYNQIIENDIEKLKKLPSAQPELPFEIQDIIDYLDTVLYPIISPDHWSVYAELYDMISALPSAQPEVKPIDYRDCANAMLKMWMLDVVTDGEYYRIMDKLNKFEIERRTNDSD